MTGNFRTKAVIAASVACITFLAYLPVLQNRFVNWDDDSYVTKNYFIRSLDVQLLRTSFLEFHAANWHPLTWLSHALDYALWGLNPLGHHLTNIILHALNALLLTLLVIRIQEVFPRPAGADKQPRQPVNDRFILIAGAAAGLLFGLHPVHVESVAWVAERKDLLCAFYYLLALIAWLHFAAGPGASRPLPARFIGKEYATALVLFALALLSKPMAVSLPVVLLILDWYVLGRMPSSSARRQVLLEKIPFALLALVSSILTVLAQKSGGAVASVQSLPVSWRLIVAAQSLIRYIMKMLVPVNLVPFYPYPPAVSFWSWEYLVPSFTVITITAACAYLFRKQKLWTALWGYYVVTLLPVLGIVQVGDQAMADRYAYLPGIGLFLILGLAAAKADQRAGAFRGNRRAAQAALVSVALAIFAALSTATVQQTGIWRNSIVFWNYVIDKEPNQAFAHDNLGDAYATAGMSDQAMAQYGEAIRLNPDYALARNNLGAEYLNRRQYDQAINQFQTAIRLKPEYALAHYNLGSAYYFKGMVDAAIGEYRISLQLDPDAAHVYFDLGNAYFNKGQTDLAIEAYLSSLRINPDAAETRYNLASAYNAGGQREKAIEQYRFAVSLKPDFADAHFNLAILYRDKGLRDLARQELETVLALKPDDGEARSLLRSLDRQ